jgi:hypothetical protein
VATQFSNREFDEWAFNNGHLERIEQPMRNESPTKKKAWLYHGERRRKLRGKLNGSGCHPDMGELAFKIVQIRRNVDMWEIAEPATFAQSIEPFEEMVRLSEFHIKSRRYALEAIPWERVSPAEKLRIDMMYQSVLDTHKFQLFFLSTVREKCEAFDLEVTKIGKKIGNPAKIAVLKRLMSSKLLPFPDDAD